jgi:hypothetical protein
VFRGPHSLGKAGTLTRPRNDSEGQVKYCRCTFFEHATPDRAGARPKVSKCAPGFAPYARVPSNPDEPASRPNAKQRGAHSGGARPYRVQCRVARCASASQPTPLFPFRVFSRVSRAPFLRQSGDTYTTTGGMPCRKHGRAKVRSRVIISDRSPKLRGLGRLEDVEDREQEDPNDIDEMPVQPGAF